MKDQQIIDIVDEVILHAISNNFIDSQGIRVPKTFRELVIPSDFYVSNRAEEEIEIHPKMRLDEDLDFDDENYFELFEVFARIEGLFGIDFGDTIFAEVDIRSLRTVQNLYDFIVQRLKPCMSRREIVWRINLIIEARTGIPYAEIDPAEPFDRSTPTAVAEAWIVISDIEMGFKAAFNLSLSFDYLRDVSCFGDLYDIVESKLAARQLQPA